MSQNYSSLPRANISKDLSKNILIIQSPQFWICFKAAETYKAAFPFNAMVEGMLNPNTVQDTVTVVRAAIKEGRWVYLIINNRAGGNAPLIAEEIVKHLDL